MTTARSVSPNTSGTSLGAGGETIKIAAEPFDDEYRDADVVLRSADLTDFYLHKVVLRRASPYFADMLSLPQPTTVDDEHAGSSVGLNDRGASQPGSRNLPIIPVSEPAAVLDTVMRMCYPVAKPSFVNVPQLSPILECALKYELKDPASVLKRQLLSFCSSKPLAVYAEAYYRCMDDVAKDAARRFAAVDHRLSTLAGFPLDKFSSHMADIPASWYYRLLEYHTQVQQWKRDTRRDSGTARETPPPTICLVQDLDLDSDSEAMLGHNTTSTSVPDPFDDPTNRDIIIRSRDNVDFHVSSAFVSFGSPTLKTLLAEAATSQATTVAGQPSSCDPIKITLPEAAHILAPLLQLCYPMPDPQVNLEDINHRFQFVVGLARAAAKYQVARATDFVKRICVSLTTAYPLRVYLVAFYFSWSGIATDAARRSVYELSDTLVPEMALASAAAYRRLLVYRRKCRELILSVAHPLYPFLNSGALYWSNCNWLSTPEAAAQAEFWSTMHQRAHESAAAGTGAHLKQHAIFPPGIKLVTNPASDAPSVDGDILTQAIGLSVKTVADTAEALEKVHK